MTNADLLSRQKALQQAAQHFQTTRAKYAIQKTLKYVKNELEAYYDTLKEIAQDYDYDLQGGLEDAPDKFQEEVNALLSEEVQNEPNVHTMPESQLDKEDDKGSDIPFEVIAVLDFMVEG